MPFSSMFKVDRHKENASPTSQASKYPYQQYGFANKQQAATQYPHPSQHGQRLAAPSPLPPREQIARPYFHPSPPAQITAQCLHEPQVMQPMPPQPSTSFLLPNPATQWSPSSRIYAIVPSSLSPPTAQNSSTLSSSLSPLPLTPQRSLSASHHPATQASAPSARSSPGPAASYRPAVKRNPPKVRKILSLDGGGVRGLSIIRIMKYIMQELNTERGLDSAPLDPWQEFDMIGGTSTGGIIAIMLGRLRMTLDECESAYSMLSETIFTPVHNAANPVRVYKFLNANGKFNSAPLEDSIKSTMWSKAISEHDLLREQDPDACKVFVCATRAEDHSLAILRSYKTRRHDPLYNICKIWEAARATSAASTFFEPIEIGPSHQKFVDGALIGKNNPVRTANTESRDIWPGEDTMILSIGTGAAPGRAVTGNLISLAKRLTEIVTDSEQTNKDFRMENNEMIRNGRLYRFNVLNGLADVGLEEHQSINKIATYTDRYLDDQDVFNMVQACVKNLNLGGQRLGIKGGEELSGMVNEMNVNDVAVLICADCLQG